MAATQTTARYRRVPQSDTAIDQEQQDKKKQAERIEQISAKLHACIWVSLSIFLAHFTNLKALLFPALFPSEAEEDTLNIVALNIAISLFAVVVGIFLYLALFLPMCQSGSQRERERESQKLRDRERLRGRERESESGTESERERESEREKEKEREREREGSRESVGLPWNIEYPNLIPIATVCGVGSYICTIVAFWPVWGFVSPLFVTFFLLGLIFSTHFIPWPCSSSSE